MKLIDLLPDYYRKSPKMQTIQTTLSTEAEKALDAMESFQEQLCLDSATWGLEYWERALGIETDVSKPFDYRRTRIASKLRGQGTTTIQMIQNVAESFSNGLVDVLEYPEEYRFDVKFTGTIGIPPNMEDMTSAIEEIKPAHLAYAYIILYNCWIDVRQKTWGGLAIKTWKEIKEVALT